MISIDFSGKNVLLTGAGGGIGGGIARAYGKAGAHVYMTDLKLGFMDSIMAEFKAAGYQGTAYELDVSNEEMIKTLVDDIVAKDGKLDILCNCAGIVLDRVYMDATSDEFARVLDINLLGTHKCMQAALKYMIEREEGKIVNIASAASRKGVPHQAFYAAAKTAVYSLTQSVALSVAAKGINVNSICPGIVDTNMVTILYEFMGANSESEKEKVLNDIINRIPQKRLQTPDDIGAAAVFLSSDLASSITGQALNVDGCMNMN